MPLRAPPVRARDRRSDRDRLHLRAAASHVLCAGRQTRRARADSGSVELLLRLGREQAWTAQDAGPDRAARTVPDRRLRPRASAQSMTA